MKKGNIKNKEIFKNFKKNNTPLPIIKLKINQQKKDIEKILNEMDKSYEFKDLIPKKKPKSQSKSKNKNIFSINEDKINEKIYFGPVTYLYYKENQNDNLTISKYTFQFLRKKLLNSKNFRVGYYNRNKKKVHLKKYINTNSNERKTETKISTSPFIENINNIKNKKEIKININYTDKNRTKDDLINENENFMDTQSTTNNNFKSKLKEIRSISNFNENNKDQTYSNMNNNEIDLISNKDFNTHSRNYNSLTFRVSLTSNNSRNHLSRHKNIKPINNYNITDYLDKKKPLDLKEIKLKNKTSSNFNDYKDFLKSYRTNAIFMSDSNHSKHCNSNSNYNYLGALTMMNEIFDIKDSAEYQKQKLNYFAKKKLNLKLIDKLLKKNVVSDNIISLLSNGKKRKIKFSYNIRKRKNQLQHLLAVDKIEKFSDSIPKEKVESFKQEYNKKSEKIGISQKCITLKNGKIYHQSKSDSKELGQKIRKNCDEIYKLRDKIMIGRYYFGEKESKCKRLYEKIKEEKIDLSINKK